MIVSSQDFLSLNLKNTHTMKYLLISLTLLFIVSCKTEVKPEKLKITSGEIKEIVTYLASDELLGRDTGSKGIDLAATYIQNQFEAYNIKPYFESYRDHFKVDSTEAFNVVGFIEGSDETLKNEVVIIGAHYDHVGFKRKVDSLKRDLRITDVDSIGNGANDNAAGTSAVIAAAKYFGIKKNNKRSILFALFSAEEKGLLGSKHLSKVLKSEDLNLYSMVNFEMIGVPLKDVEYTAFITGYELSNFGKNMNEYINEENFFGVSEVSKKYKLFSKSDNYPFYQEFQVPCHTISSCDLNNFDYYHHADDETEQLNFDFMASLINKTLPAIEHLVNFPTKAIKLYED